LVFEEFRKVAKERILRPADAFGYLIPTRPQEGLYPLVDFGLQEDVKLCISADGSLVAADQIDSTSQASALTPGIVQFKGRFITTDRKDRTAAR
jgi:hypothetical protein